MNARNYFDRLPSVIDIPLIIILPVKILSIEQRLEDSPLLSAYTASMRTRLHGSLSWARLLKGYNTALGLTEQNHGQANQNSFLNLLISVKNVKINPIIINVKIII